MKYDLETLMMVIDTLDKNASGYRLIEETSEDTTRYGANCAAKALERMAVHLSKLMAQMIINDARQNRMECVECDEELL